MNDLKVAVRALRTRAGFSAAVILTMAVAIGANTAIFSVYDRLVLNPVTIPDASSLIAIWFNNPIRNIQTPNMSVPRYDGLRAEARSFASLGLSTFDSFTLTGAGDPAQLTGLRVSASFMPTLGIGPAKGRAFRDDEDVPNGPAVCILSHELWQRQFGGRESLIGQTIQLNGTAWEVVGIMPPRLTAPFGQVQVFAPRVFEVGGLTPAQIAGGAGYAQAIARLKPGATMDQARTELAAISAGYKARFPANVDAANIGEPRPFVAALVSGFTPTMYTLIGAVTCVLLIACANVASLFLSRLLQRRKEIAVRLSLGATRAAIVRQFMVESLIFSVAAGVLGVLIALWALGGLQSVIAAQLPANATLALNWRALAFTGAVTLALHDPDGSGPGAAGLARRRRRASQGQLARHLDRAGWTLPPGPDRLGSHAVGRPADRRRAPAGEFREGAARRARVRAGRHSRRLRGAAAGALRDAAAADRFLRAGDRRPCARSRA